MMGFTVEFSCMSIMDFDHIHTCPIMPSCSSFLLSLVPFSFHLFLKKKEKKNLHSEYERRHPISDSTSHPSLGVSLYLHVSLVSVFFFLQSHKTPWVPPCSYDLVLLIYLSLYSSRALETSLGGCQTNSLHLLTSLASSLVLVPGEGLCPLLCTSSSLGYLFHPLGALSFAWFLVTTGFPWCVALLLHSSLLSGG